MSTEKLLASHARSVERENEFRCSICRARCTRTPEGLEVGHRYGCPERPDHLPNGGASGGAYYSEDDR
ncbi:hypothetical protein [Haladaptatus sp. CMAA 1911]|uniref:hypothetical protein n=1 Tax=unclassified Haladaptatus TaxID=2622732 RepID=UPI003754996B